MAGRRWFRLDVGWSRSEWLADLEPAARLAWIELLGYAKAEGAGGRVRAMAPKVFGRIVGIAPADVEALLAAALADGAISVDGGDWVVANWPEYQEPDPTAAERKRRQRARDVTLGHGSHAVTPSRDPRQKTETEDRTDEQHSSGSDEPNTDRAAVVIEVFEYCRERTGHQRITLTEDRRRKIKARLKRFTPEQLKQAIDGAAKNPFYQGENDRGQRYDFPETIFKNDGAVEKHIEFAISGPARASPARNGKGGPRKYDYSNSTKEWEDPWQTSPASSPPEN